MICKNECEVHNKRMPVNLAFVTGVVMNSLRISQFILSVNRSLTQIGKTLISRLHGCAGCSES